MSKFAIAAVSATVMLAVTSVLLTKVVELTVTPPGSRGAGYKPFRLRAVLEALAIDLYVQVNRALCGRRRIGGGDLDGRTLSLAKPGH